MLVISSIVVTLIPISLILYIFFKKTSLHEFEKIRPDSNFQYRNQWDNAVQGLVNAEIEVAIGNLDQSDYEWIRTQYINEAAIALRSMELPKIQEDRMLKDLQKEVASANSKIDTVDNFIEVGNS